MSDPYAKRLWFKEQILPHRSALRGRIRRILPQGYEIDDIIAETMARAFACDAWQEVRSGLAFITQIARNLLIDLNRRESVISFDFMADLEELQRSVSSEAMLDARDQLRFVERAIAELPVPARHVFVLRRVHQLSVGEVAEKLGLSVSSIEKHLTRAQLAISRAMAEYEGDVGEQRVQNAIRARRHRHAGGAVDAAARREP
jgi:RNA polymerase sigma-70 factor (ECF subfamily)